MSNFMHPDLGASAVALALSSTLSEERRIAALQYIRNIDYKDGFYKLLTQASTAENGDLKSETLITCSVLRPDHPLFIAEIKKLIA
jgi:hypothetical protein